MYKSDLVIAALKTLCIKLFVTLATMILSGYIHASLPTLQARYDSDKQKCCGFLNTP